MQGNATTVPLHLIIYSPAMTSQAPIAAGEVSLFHNGERNNGSPLYLLTNLMDKMELLWIF